MQNHLKKLVPLALLLALPGCAAHVGAGGAIGPAGHVAGGPQGHGPGMGGRPPHVRAPRGGPGGANHAAARAALTQNACDPGYQFDQARRVCYEQHEPVLVARAKCELGQMRRVPDPSHPGGVRIRMGGFVGHGTGAGQMHAMSPVY